MTTTLKPPIAPPTRDERRAAFRRVLEAAAQATPITAALAHLYGYTHPSQFERDLQEFWATLAAAANDHEARLIRLEEHVAPRLVLGAQALDVMIWMLRANTSGRCDPINFDTVAAAFADVDRKRLEEAIAELCHHGYATKTATLSHPMARIRLAPAAFLGFDLIATGTDTRADAVQVASLWLDQENLRSVYKLSAHLNWPLRRLNPTLLALEHVFPQGRWSQEIHPNFETTSVLVTPDERFRLRRIVDTGRVD